ncbi:MAG: hypothetical protein R3B72_15380 [Polyangiaceae bacterium]
MGLGALLLVACDVPPPTSPTAGVRLRGDGRVPPKPGDSITKTMMCSCNVCEPASCCRELEQDRPEIDDGCADGYDFSACDTTVSSCGASCFQHRWRTEVAVGCAASRPDRCCHGSSDF